MAQPHSDMPDFDVVILGTDLGVYSYARAFHVRYGIRSTVIARVPAGPIRNSNIIDVISLGRGPSALKPLRHLRKSANENWKLGGKHYS